MRTIRSFSHDKFAIEYYQIMIKSVVRIERGGNNNNTYIRVNLLSIHGQQCQFERFKYHIEQIFVRLIAKLFLNGLCDGTFDEIILKL